MDYFSTDYLIIYAFLVITLVIGLRAGRGIKDTREYVLANRSFGTVALVGTFLATDIAGESILDLTGEVNQAGIILAVVFIAGVGISFIMQAIFIAPKMGYFGKCITMGDVMGTLYGNNSQIITGVLGFFTAICVAGMDLTVMGLLCETLLGLDYRMGVGIGGCVLAAYTAHGGIKSVTVTDLVQLLIFLAVLPIVVVIALQHAGGITTILAQVPSEKLQIISHSNFSFYLTLFLFKIVFHFYMIDPALIQRLLMAKNKHQLRSQFLALSIFSPVIYTALMLLGLAGLVLYPNLSGVQVMPQIINDLLPVGVKGLAMVGLFAITMATIDSFLHAAGITLVHDIVKPLCDKYNLAINELGWIKGATVGVSLFAIAIGLIRADRLSSLLFASTAFAGPLLAFPLFGGILGLKTDKYDFYTAAWITVVVLLFTKYALFPESQEHLAVLISVITNGIIFLGMHVWRNKGFVLANRSIDTGYLIDYMQRTEKPLATWISIPWRIVKDAQKQVAEYGAPYMLFGFILITYYIVSPFIWDHEDAAAWELILYLRLLGTLACGFLVVKDKWPQSLLPYLPTFWHLTLLYCLPFTSTVMLLLTQGSVEWLINVTLSIILLIFLVDWGMLLILTTLGITLGLLFYTQLVGPVALRLDFSTGYLLVYQGIFATLIGLIFARRKQLNFDTLATQRERLAIDNQATKADLLEATEKEFRFVSMLKKAGIEQLGSVAHLSKRLLELSRETGGNKEVTTLAQQLTDQLMPMALSMDRFAHRTTGFLLLDGVETILLDNFLQALQQALHTKGQRLKIEVRTQLKTLQCDVEKIRKVILNSVSFLHSVAGEEALVLLGVEDTQLGYDMDSVSPDHIKQISALRFTITTAHTLPKLATLYMSQIGEESLMQPEAPTNLPLLANERIVKAHYGYSGTIGTGHGVALVYVIPIDVREVRSKDMDTPQMQLGASWPRADDTYPGAQEQEMEFLKAVKERSKADLTLVQKAISLIKDYHGPIMRESGEPFYLHPMAVAQIALDYNQEEATLLGALLHDTVEDTPLTLEQIALLFNQEVSTIVQGVTHMESNKATNYKVLLSHPENIHRLLEAEDKRVLYVKLADRMHNLRTLQAKPDESQRRTAEETLLFFVHLARYLRLSEAAEELKQRSFDVLGSV
jgi:Na+/proline symporter